MIKKIHIENFRSLKNFDINFEEDITLIIGENDCGKTSVIESLKILFGINNMEIDDFSNGTNEASIEVKINNNSYIKNLKKNDASIDDTTLIKLDKKEVDEIRDEMGSSSFKSKVEEEKKAKLFEFAKKIGLNTGRISRVDTLTTKIEEKIVELEENEYSAPINQIPNDYNLFFLDGKKFQNLDEHINELYFNQIKQEIWKKEVSGETIEEIVTKTLEESVKDLEDQIKKQGSIEKLREYLPNITNIKIIPELTPRLNVGVKVQLLEETEVIPVEKKGDGTKRRITMALLEIKKDIDDEQSHSYIFDEPDTHLHVKAQLDLLNILWSFIENKKQVIITSHSPFILNSLPPQKIRLLTLKNYQTEIIPIDTDENVLSTMKSLGISNTNLFFSKKILLVEGHAEEKFIPKVFEKMYGISLQSILVKIISGDGIEDASKVAKVFRDFEFFKDDEIYLLIDNDGNKKLKKFINELEIPKENLRELGYKEFEDSFDPLIIYEAWNDYVKLNVTEEVYDNFEKKWTYETIKLLRETCIKNELKFSAKLVDYSREECYVPMSKVDLSIALSKKVEKKDLDPKIVYIFEKLNGEI